MGTKNKPGDFDCYHAADPDEPMFILLARDAAAADLVDEWADIRETMVNEGAKPESDRAKVAEARACATAMRKWWADHHPLPKYES